MLEALRLEAPGARVVWVSSCEVYGPAATLPIAEDAPLAPANPYAVSKTAGDLLAGVYADAHGLESVRARPFNHAGPGPAADLHRLLARPPGGRGRAAGATTLRIVTGNPDTRRDFTDVRDVVRAYRLLRRAGRRRRDLQRQLGTVGLRRRAGRAARRADRADQGRARRRSRARARARGDGPARRLLAPARRHRLGARDPVPADDCRHDRVVGAASSRTEFSRRRRATLTRAPA